MVNYVKRIKTIKTRVWDTRTIIGSQHSVYIFICCRTIQVNVTGLVFWGENLFQGAYIYAESES